MLLLGMLIAVVAPLAFAQPWERWILRATVFIVAAAPCALVISIPITLVAALGTAARNGVLIKGGVYIEELTKVAVVAMDKTVTRGEPEVTDVLPLHDGSTGVSRSAHELRALAAGIERRSEHPLARAVVRRAGEDNILPVDITDFRALPGAGASGRLVRTTVYVGSPELFEKRLGIPVTSMDQVIRLQGEDKTVALVGDEQGAWGLVAIRDTIRPNARRAIAALHDLGVKVAMLTGDNSRTTQAIAQEVGIDEAYSDLKPEDKVVKIRELASRHGGTGNGRCCTDGR